MTNLKVVKAASTDLNLKIQGLVSTHKDLRTAHNDFVQRATATLSAFAERENQVRRFPSRRSAALTRGSGAHGQFGLYH